MPPVNGLLQPMDRRLPLEKLVPAKGPAENHGHIEARPLWPGDATPKRVLVTGGASCPDGIIQQVITRINSLFPADALRPIDAVLTDLSTGEG